MTSKEALEVMINFKECWIELYKLYYKVNDNDKIIEEQIDYFDKAFNYIKNNLEKLEKLEKALEIIKRKDICPTNLYSAIDYDKYKFAVKFDRIDKEWILTEKEFNLLNEVFYNE